MNKKMKKTRLIILVVSLVVVICIGVLGAFYFNYHIVYNGNAVVCAEEAKLCPDGTAVGRNATNKCEFDKCKDLEYCDTNKSCNVGNCYLFDDNSRTYCYSGNPCNKCSGGNCDLLKTNPVQIVCGR